VEGSFPEVNTHDLSRKVGKVLSHEHDIDLTSPDLKVRVLLSEKVHFFISEYEIDRKQFDRRKVAERPFFSPISLHPRYARALINLTEAKRGGTVLDPFCGTGGIVLEAALLGMKSLGSDIDPEMVEGCKRNLEHFGVEAEVQVADVGDVPSVFGMVGTVATDPPYGRAASTKKEDIDILYRRGIKASAEVLSPGSRAGIVLPREVKTDEMDLLELHRQRVHRSLTRHYHIFIRR
jgi:tRNA (guanine10-N2)-dimethyltransferase